MWILWKVGIKSCILNVIMKTQEKKEIRQIFNEGFTQLVLPLIDDIHKNMATKQDIANIRKEMATKKDIAEIREEMATKEDIKDLSNDFDSINRKLDAEISWRDGASKRLKKVEIKTGLVR